MMRLPPRKYPLGALLLATAATIPVAPVMFAEEAADIEEVVVTGTRRPGRSQGDLPVAVDVLSEESMKNTGQTEVGRILQTLAPSFNFSSSSISDGTDALRPATLRGLGPDQTLVLVNGKRRHNAALINVNTSVGRGAAGVDLNGIPSSAIKRIEVLRDGAAAQYGSDAIAGVINIILKDDDESGSVSTSYGEYKDDDGETSVVSLNKGFAFGDNGFINTTFEYRDRGDTNRAGLSGSCQYIASGKCDVPATLDPREATFDRENFRIGDSDSEQLTAIVNAGVDFRGGELYAFATYSDRENESAGFYRKANQGARNPALNDLDAFYPNGFLPLIETDIDDYSFGFGYRYEFANDLSMDLSFVTGRNEFGFTINNSVNASFANQQRIDGVADDVNRATTPRSADAGDLEMGLTTFNADFVKLMDDFTVSFGFEYREDEYEIKAGELYSYADFDGVAAAGVADNSAEAGIQVFPGFQPANEVDEDRDVVSVYLDVEYDVSDQLLLTGAIRYDDYSDFGDTVNLKGAMRYIVSDLVTIRGAVSTGFRAPSMQQQFFNNESTQFVTEIINGVEETVAQQVVTLRNDSAIAKAVGIPELEEEESFNVSLGIALEPTEALSITLDYYNIDIDDRIVISNRITTDAGRSQFFLNGADTRTEGWDLVTTYGMEVFNGNLDLTLSGNMTDTSVTGKFDGSGLVGATAGQVFSAQDESIIEDWQPESRFSVSALYQRDAWSVSLSFNRYGEYKVHEGLDANGGDIEQTFSAKVLTDVRVNYAFENGLSVNLGGNNVFDQTPDKNKIGQSRGGTIVGADGNTIVSSPGVFQFSRRSAPFGFNGSYFYGGVSYDF